MFSRRHQDLNTLPGWNTASMDGVLSAFLSVDEEILARRLENLCGARACDTDPEPPFAARLAKSLITAASAVDPTDSAAVRTFFEPHFVASPHGPDDQPGDTSSDAGLLTGYFEPVLSARRMWSPDFSVPLYGRPRDLVNVVGEDDRAAAGTGGVPPLTHLRQVMQLGESVLVPFPDRAAIEDGALDGQDLELAYLSDPVDRFILQVQGSGCLVFEDGTQRRVTYDGKNGHPYTSIGAELIREGIIAAGDMTLERLTAWLKANPTAGRNLMHRNRSFVFFRWLDGDEPNRACGVLGTPLQAMRSAAVDPAHHELALPIWVTSAAVVGLPTQNESLHRLMIAHDVGSAIKGPNRLDMFCGSGVDAGRIAGALCQPAQLTSLVPRALAAEAVRSRSEKRDADRTL